jgi:cytochrome c2
MPDLGLTAAEIDGVLALFAKTAGRTYPEPAAPLAKIDGAHQGEGQLLFFLRCTECHNFGTVIPTPLAKQQGPDLIHLAERLRGDWLPKWISDPKSLYPDTRMTNPGLKPEEVEAVREFIWNTSVDGLPQKP